MDLTRTWPQENPVIAKQEELSPVFLRSVAANSLLGKQGSAWPRFDGFNVHQTFFALFPPELRIAG
jgi:hypothetical protein